jgi:hypothetical protein
MSETGQSGAEDSVWRFLRRFRRPGYGIVRSQPTPGLERKDTPE